MSLSDLLANSSSDLTLFIVPYWFGQVHLSSILPESYWSLSDEEGKWTVVGQMWYQFERGTRTIFDPQIVENIDFAIRKRYVLNFWPKNGRKHGFCSSKEVRTRFLTKTSILRFERGTYSIFDPKIVENIDFAVRKRYQLDFWPKYRRKHRFCGSKKVPTRFLTQKSSKTSILRF